VFAIVISKILLNSEGRYALVSPIPVPRLVSIVHKKYFKEMSLFDGGPVFEMPIFVPRQVSMFYTDYIKRCLSFEGCLAVESPITVPWGGLNACQIL